MLQKQCSERVLVAFFKRTHNKIYTVYKVKMEKKKCWERHWNEVSSVCLILNFFHSHHPSGHAMKNQGEKSWRSWNETAIEHADDTSGWRVSLSQFSIAAIFQHGIDFLAQIFTENIWSFQAFYLSLVNSLQVVGTFRALENFVLLLLQSSMWKFPLYHFIVNTQRRVYRFFPNDLNIFLWKLMYQWKIMKKNAFLLSPRILRDGKWKIRCSRTVIRWISWTTFIKIVWSSLI